MGRVVARGRIGLLLVALSAHGIGGCASEPKPGVVHVVRSGETVWRIAYIYGVSTEAVIRANDIRDVNSLRVGQRLWIPGARPDGVRRTPPPPPTAPRGRPSAECIQASREGLAFAWPLRGKLTSRFGRRGRGRHDGIDLSAPRGTPIRAVEAGRVIHSGGGLGAYGNVVIVKHVGRWASVYAHNRRNTVPEGAFVERGDVVGEVGTSGNATGPHLHLEIRRDGRARDPLPCLP